MKNKVYWETKEGRKIDIDTWSDLTHMRNVLKMLIRERESEWRADELCGNYDFGDLQDTF